MALVTHGLLLSVTLFLCWADLTPGAGFLVREGKTTGCQGSILIVGGRNKNERGGFVSLSSVEQFGCGNCTELSLPVSRDDHLSGLTHDGVILVCGGWDPNGSHVYNCISFNRKTRTWDQHSTLPSFWGKSGSRIAFTETGTYILGGTDGRKTSVFLPLGGNTWIEGPEIPGKGVSSSCVTSVNSTHIIVTGGSGPLEPRQIRILDVTTNTWKKLPNLPYGVKGHACIMTKDGVMVTGGLMTDTGAITTQTLIIDPDTGKIEEIGPLMTPRYWHSMALVGETVTVVGGNDGKYHYLASTEQYKNGSWVTGEFTLETGRDKFGIITLPDTVMCN